MKPILFAIALAIIPAMAISADIASVNYKAVREDLREYYFSKPENAKFKAQYTSAVSDEIAFHEKMRKEIRDGQKPTDMQVAMMQGGMNSSIRFQLDRKIDSDIKKELYLIIAGLGLKYELIYDSSEYGTVIYATSQIDDITTTVKQAIIDLRQK